MDSEFRDKIIDLDKPLHLFPNLPKEHALYRGVHCSWPGIKCRCQDYVKHRPDCHWRNQWEWERNPKCDCLGNKLNIEVEFRVNGKLIDG